MENLLTPSLVSRRAPISFYLIDFDNVGSVFTNMLLSSIAKGVSSGDSIEYVFMGLPCRLYMMSTPSVLPKYLDFFLYGIPRNFCHINLLQSTLRRVAIATLLRYINE
jgi:hypothetical protein